MVDREEYGPFSNSHQYDSVRHYETVNCKRKQMRVTVCFFVAAHKYCICKNWIHCVWNCVSDPIGPALFSILFRICYGTLISNCYLSLRCLAITLTCAKSHSFVIKIQCLVRYYGIAMLIYNGIRRI